MSKKCTPYTTASRGPAAATRAAAPPEGSVLRLPHDSQPRASGGHARRSSACPLLRQEALCTAPATLV